MNDQNDDMHVCCTGMTARAFDAHTTRFLRDYLMHKRVSHHRMTKHDTSILGILFSIIAIVVVVGIIYNLVD